jgi:eukaryotic-like serine/threonine-protein kinase
MVLAAGSKLGPYEIQSPLGTGGMGEVYRARDTKLDRDVAIKVLPAAFARDADRMARFQREAKLLASLNHRNIAAIYGLEDSAGTPALVMELVQGPTLADRMKAGPIPIDEALPIAKQISEALEYAHERGIVHRDLKPANVKVTKEDEVKVLDFGLAKAIEGDPESSDISNSPTISRMATQAGVLLGTAAYMSPEQARGKAVDRRTDIWAFGCVLYEMLTGRMTFQGESVTDRLAAVIRAEPDWSQLPEATPTRVRVLLQRCLQKDLKQRLQAIGDARISLDEVLSGAPEPSPAAAVSATTPFWRRALPWALFAAALVALGVLGFVHFREKPKVAEVVRLQLPVPEKMIMPVASSFALSPDGRQLAFYAMGADAVQHLWVRSMDSLEARPLPGSESTPNPAPIFWSPDSQYIVFDGGGKLKKIGISGGPAQTLCDMSGNSIGGSWNSDGVILFGQSPGPIMRVSANGGPSSVLTILDSSKAESNHAFPSFLPDGRHFLYLRLSRQPENSGVYVGSLNAKPEEQASKLLIKTAFGVAYVPSSNPDSGQLLFVRDGALMAQPFDAHRLELSGVPVPVAEKLGTYREFGFFSASKNGILVYRAGGGGGEIQLTWYDRQGKVLGTAGERGFYVSPALSPDGKEAAVSQIDLKDGKRIIWLVDFSRGTSTRLTFGSGSAEFPIWSPDGKRILYMSNPDGVFDLYQKLASGAKEEELLLKSSETKAPTSVSLDGRFLLYFLVDPKTSLDLWVLPLMGDKKPFPFLRTKYNEADGDFSPDGHWVAYRSDESGRYEIYVRRFSPDSPAEGTDTGGKWQVSYSGGIEPRWSTDGKKLYYLTLDWKVMEVEVSTNPAFRAGTPKLLFQGPLQRGITHGRYTVDGKRFLFRAPVEQTAQAPFTVVLNWQSALKR